MLPAPDVTVASVEYVYVTAVTADGAFFGQLAKYDSGTKLHSFSNVSLEASVAFWMFIFCVLYLHLFYPIKNLLARWLGVATVRTLDLGSKGREFNSWSGHCHVVTTWMDDCLRTGKLYRYVTGWPQVLKSP